MSIKKILVTGGSGFIGTNLVKLLLEKKFEVHNLDKTSYSSVPNKFNNFNNKKYFFYKVDLLNQNKTKKILVNIKPDAIINLAAESHVDRSIDKPNKFFNNNVMGCLNLLESLRKISKKIKLKKFIHISTDEVFGGDNKNLSKENDKYETNSPYSASKASCDHLCRAFYKTFKIPTIVVHCCNNYGPYQFTEKFIPTIISKHADNLPIPLYGTGKNVREWIYVDDFCQAIFKVLKKGKIGEKYNVGSNESINNKNIIKLISKMLNKFSNKYNHNFIIKKVKDRPGHDIKYQINSTKIRKELSWKNKYSLKEGLKKTILWYLNNKKWLDHCKKNYKGNRQGLLK